MQNSTPDVLEQVPAGGGVNKPASGTYGEKADLARLQQELPSSETAAPQRQVSPVPPATSRGVASAQPPGFPRGLTLPTSRPDEPIATPLEQPTDPFAGTTDDRQRRIRYLTLLEQQATSPEVREWARIVRERLGG